MFKSLLNSVLILVFLFCVINTNAQILDSKYDEYFKISKMPIDSFPDYILELKEKLMLAEAKNDTFLIAEKNLFLASIYYSLHSFDIAIDYNLKALSIFEQSPDTIYTIFALHNLSAMYGIINDYTALETV